MSTHSYDAPRFHLVVKKIWRSSTDIQILPIFYLMSNIVNLETWYILGV